MRRLVIGGGGGVEAQLAWMRADLADRQRKRDVTAAKAAAAIYAQTYPRHAPMPPLPIGRGSREHAAPATRLSPTHAPVPGLGISMAAAHSAPRATARLPLSANHSWMPGLSFGAPR